jgi:hypothetical protein
MEFLMWLRTESSASTIRRPPRYVSVLFVGGVIGLVFLTSGAQAGILTGTLSSGPGSADLTTQGNTDWAVWGYADDGTSASLAPNDRKSGGIGISFLTELSNGNPLRALGQFGSYGETLFSWSDGTPVTSAGSAYTGLQLDGSADIASTVGEGFSFTVAASTALSVLYVYTSVNLGIASVTASLSDDSADPVTQILSASSGNNVPFLSQFDFAADTAGQLLTVTLDLTQDDSCNIGACNTGNIAIQAAALSAVPEPSTLTLFGAAVTFVPLVTRRRRGIKALYPRQT